MIALAPSEDTLKKGIESFEKGMGLLRSGDLMKAEAEFDSARAYFEARQSANHGTNVAIKRDETRGWLAYTKAVRAMHFGREAEDGGESLVASGSYRKAYNQFMQSVEIFSSIRKPKEAERARGYMHMANGLNFSAEGDLAFEKDEFTKSIELYQKALMHLNLSAESFKAIDDKENMAEVGKMAAQTNADVWISEGHYNLELSRSASEDELLARSEYERAAAEAFKKAVSFIETMGDEELLANAKPSILFAEALHKVSVARYQTHMAEERFTEADYAEAIKLYDEASAGFDEAFRLYEKMTGFVPEEDRTQQKDQIFGMRRHNDGMRELSAGFENLWNDDTAKAGEAFAKAAAHFNVLDSQGQRYRCLKYEALSKVWKGKSRDDGSISALAFSSMQAGQLLMKMAASAEREAEEDWNEANIFKKLAANVPAKPKEDHGDEAGSGAHLDMISRGNREKSAMGYDAAKHWYRRATREFSDAARFFAKVGNDAVKEAEKYRASSQALSYLAQAKYFRRRAEGDASNAMEAREGLDKAVELIRASKARLEGFDDKGTLREITEEEGVVTLMRNYLAAEQSFSTAKKLEEAGELSDAAVKYEEAAKYVNESMAILELANPGLLPAEQTSVMRLASAMYTAFAHNAMARHLELEADKSGSSGNAAMQVKYLRKSAEEFKKASDALAVPGLPQDENIAQHSEQFYESYLRANSKANLLEGKTGVY